MYCPTHAVLHMLLVTVIYMDFPERGKMIWKGTHSPLLYATKTISKTDQSNLHFHQLSMSHHTSLHSQHLVLLFFSLSLKLVHNNSVITSLIYLSSWLLKIWRRLLYAVVIICNKLLYNGISVPFFSIGLSVLYQFWVTFTYST